MDETLDFLNQHAMAIFYMIIFWGILLNALASYLLECRFDKICNHWTTMFLNMDKKINDKEQRMLRVIGDHSLRIEELKPKKKRRK